MDNKAQHINTQPVQALSILIVEDEILIRMYLAEELRSAGFSVVEAADAFEAQRALSEIDGIKIIISDVVMPGDLDGIGLARWVRRMRPEIKVIISSASTRHCDDADEVMPKPFEIAEMLAAVRRLLPDREQNS